jgi:hypothetical protein
MSLEPKIRALYEQGMSYNQIKAELGCSKGTISYHLGDGQKEKSRARLRSSRLNIRKHIQEYKQSTICTDCREDYPYWILEFDHINDDKSFTIGKFQETTSSIDVIKAEIDKCEVVCANCHKNRTHTRRTAIAHDKMDLSEFYE